MGWLGDIITGIGAVLAPVTGGISLAVAGGINAIGSVVGPVVKGVSTLVQDSGIGSLLSLVTDITGSIDGLVKSIDLNLGGIIDPIKNVVDSVKTLSTDITDRIINPLIKPISETVSQISGLTKTIDHLVDDGLSGIIKIPQAISDALTGVGASWDRATLALAKSNADIVARSLNPAIKDAVAPGLEAITGAFLAFNKNSAFNVVDEKQLTLSEGFGAKQNKEILEKVARILEHPDGLFEGLIYAAVNTFRFIVATSTTLISEIEEGTMDAKASNPVTPLGPADVVTLYRLGILNRENAVAEVAKSGISQDRFNALVQADHYLPSANEAISWMLKGLITASEADDILAKRGYNAGAAKAALAAAAISLPEDTLLDWLARGYIDNPAFDSALRSKGYSDKQISTVIRDALAEPQVNTAINAYWSEFATAQGWFAETYGSAPPSEVIQAGVRTRVDPVETVRRWRSQFSAMPIQTAIGLFFRGEMTRGQVEVVVVQNGYPRDMTGLLIKAQTPLIPSRSIPTLVAKGEISKGEGVDRLIAKGFSVEDASLLIAAATDTDPATGPAPATEQSKLTVAQIRGAYKDGIIDENTARGLMALQGLADFDIEFYVAQDNYDLNAKAVADEIDTIKSEVALGVLSMEDATQQLFDLSLPEGQVAKVLVALGQAQRANAKIPDLGLLKQMAKAGFLVKEDFLAGVQALGYGAPWDELITALQFTPGVQTDGT